MPTTETLLAGLTAIANEWRWLAITWHVLLGGFLVALAAGWRPPVRLMAWLLISPILSVALLAWRARNPFTGTLFLGLAAALAGTAVRFPTARVELASPARVTTGLALATYGAAYPHFVRVESWLTYIYASPFGLLPCPSLSAVIGCTLIVDNFRSPLWTTVLAGAGLLYGVIGVFRLGVSLDIALLAATGILIVATTRSRSTQTDGM